MHYAAGKLGARGKLIVNMQSVVVARKAREGGDILCRDGAGYALGLTHLKPINRIVGRSDAVRHILPLLGREPTGVRECKCVACISSKRLAVLDLTQAEVSARVLPGQKATEPKRELCMLSTFDTVAEVISSTSDIDKSLITPESHIMKDLSVDSLAFLDIAFEIDQKFGITMPVEDWMQKINEGKAKSEDFFVIGKLCQMIDVLVALKVAA